MARKTAKTPKTEPAHDKVPDSKKANGDMESWVKSRIRTAIRMSLALENAVRVGADRTLCDQASEGVLNGAAIEVIRHLGMEPSFANLYRDKPPGHVWATLDELTGGKENGEWHITYHNVPQDS